MNHVHGKAAGRKAGATLLCILWGALALTGCMGTSGDVELLPESREGMFYNVFAEAQQEAQKQNKHILLDLWRPG